MTTLIWMAVIGACISYWWSRYGNKMFGIGPLPPGYTLTMKNNYDVFQSLHVYKGSEEIVDAGNIRVYGYRVIARKAVRAAWIHYNITKVEDAR